MNKSETGHDVSARAAAVIGRAVVDGTLSTDSLLVDVVLVLLRADCVEDAERLAGVPLRRMPPDPRLRPRDLLSPRPEEPTVVVVLPRRFQSPGSAAETRFRAIRPGMTLSQLRSRGVTARDLRDWRSHVFVTA